MAEIHGLKSAASEGTTGTVFRAGGGKARILLRPGHFGKTFFKSVNKSDISTFLDGNYFEKTALILF